LCVAEHSRLAAGMADADFYRKQAELLLGWAAAADDAIVKEQLRGRAQSYLTIAARLAPPCPPASAQPATAQQHQQIQPEAKPPDGKE
jgi:hypothetical protein